MTTEHQEKAEPIVDSAVSAANLVELIKDLKPGETLEVKNHVPTVPTIKGPKALNKDQWKQKRKRVKATKRSRKTNRSK